MHARRRRLAGRVRSAASGLAALDRQDRRLAAEACAEVVRAAVVLAVTPERRTTARLGVPDPRPSAVTERVAEAEHIGQLVGRVAGALPGRPACLPRSLALRRMLHRRGIACRVHLGVTGPPAFASHAWVSVDGRPVGETAGLERFQPVATFR